MANLEISRAQRLDQYVAQQLPLVSRAFAARLVNDGKVTVNGAVQTKSGTKMKAGDDVVIEFNDDELLEIPHIDLPIIYEDDDCVVINKPEGLLTHSKGVFNPEATVATWLRERFNGPLSDEPDELTIQNQRVGIVHRLDRATSGVMICAKNPEALSWLQKQFGQRRVKKTYAAVVSGHFDQPHAIIDMAIERNPKQPQTFRVGINGKTAQTEYRVVKATDTLSLLELKPTTGRTHQLRVHLEHLKHPIVGDPLYKGAKADRLYLHAEHLELTLPSRERKTFSVQIPQTFYDLLEQ